VRKRLPDTTVEALIVLGILSVLFAGAIAGITVWLVDYDHGPAQAAETTPAETGAPAETTAPETTAPAETTEAASTEAGTTEAESETEAETGGGQGDPAAGEQVFASAGCAGCHTLSAAGATGTVGPNLDDVKPDFDTVVTFVTNGSGPMPAFGEQGILTEQQIQDVAAYVVQSTSG
jgi:mono/diheme cytochrome c family protein